MSDVNQYFQEEPDQLVIKVTGLNVMPVTLKISGEDVVQEMIVLESDDFTGRFPNGQYSYRFKPSRNKNSKWQMWLKKCREQLGIKIEKDTDIIGRYFLVNLVEWKWSDEMKATVPELVRELKGEAEARNIAAEINSTVGGQDDELEFSIADRVAELADGHIQNDILQSALAVPEIAQDNNLLQGIVSGVYLQTLVDAGMLSRDEQGVYHRAN